MVDIFSIPESELTLEHVRAFLAVDDDTPLDERPKEGVRIDYKSRKPGDLARLIVAFANSHGGIGFLGVEEKHGAPVALCGYPRGKTDLKTSIAGAIRSSVYPPYPEYEVIVLALNATHDIALVRVEEGQDPPYQHQDGTVYVRAVDQTAHARVQEIVELASKAAAADASLNDTGFPESVWIRRLSADDRQLSRSESHISLCVRPMRVRGIRLDRRAENAISELISERFGLPFHVEARRGPLVEWKHYDSIKDFDRRIAVAEDGRIFYTGQVLHDGKTLILPIIDVAGSFCAFASAFLRATRHHGRIEFAVHLSTASTEVVGQRDGFGRELLGIHEVGPDSRYAELTVLTALVDHLVPGDKLVAKGLFEQLRNERGASIEYRIFANAIRERLLTERSSEASPVLDR